MVGPIETARGRRVVSSSASLGALLKSDDDPPFSPEGRRRAKDAILRFFRAIAARDMAALAEGLTEDVVYEMPFSETGSTEPGQFRCFTGRAEVVAFWEQTSATGLRSLPPEDVELSITADGGRVFIEQRGNMTTADGKAYRNRYVFRFDITDGRVRHVREYINPIISAYAFARPVANAFMIEKL